MTRWWEVGPFWPGKNGGNQRPILTKDEDQGTPSWAKNGRIAFIDVDPFDVYWMNSDGSGVVNVTNTPGIAEYQPAWSPDGTKIAYSLHPRLFADADISDPDNADIWVSNADGSHPVNITNHPGIDYEAAWSPDGSQIVFRSNRNGFWDLFVISANGTRLRQLTGLASSERTPSWSPDGSMMVFASSRVCEGDQARGDHEIFVMNADGTGITCITRNSLGDQSPAWKP